MTQNLPHPTIRVGNNGKFTLCNLTKDEAEVARECFARVFPERPRTVGEQDSIDGKALFSFTAQMQRGESKNLFMPYLATHGLTFNNSDTMDAEIEASFSPKVEILTSRYGDAPAQIKLKIENLNQEQSAQALEVFNTIFFDPTPQGEGQPRFVHPPERPKPTASATQNSFTACVNDAAEANTLLSRFSSQGVMHLPNLNQLRLDIQEADKALYQRGGGEVTIG